MSAWTRKRRAHRSVVGHGAFVADVSRARVVGAGPLGAVGEDPVVRRHAVVAAFRAAAGPQPETVHHDATRELACVQIFLVSVVPGDLAELDRRRVTCSLSQVSDAISGTRNVTAVDTFSDEKKTLRTI